MDGQVMGGEMMDSQVMDGQPMQGEVIYEGQFPMGMPVEPAMGEMIPLETIPVQGPTIESPLLPFESPSAMSLPRTSSPQGGTPSVPVTRVSTGANNVYPSTDPSLKYPLTDWKP